jgi:uncharacterized membrane protein YjgN (DUF898 family)
MTEQSDNNKEFDWFDKKENQKKLWIVMYASCIISTLAGFIVKRHSHFVHEGDDHGHHEHHFSAAEELLVKLEVLPFFYALMGFVGCVLAILVAKGVGKWLKVPEDYYDDK